MLLIFLLAAATLLWTGTSPAGAQDGHQPDPQVVDKVWEYAEETDNGFDHVLRWVRVLQTFGEIEDMTAAEAQANADQHLAERWDPVVAELTNLEAQDDYQPDARVVSDVRGYARETDNGFDHVLRWLRALKTMGALADMTAAEAQGYADQGWTRWEPVAAELAAMEAPASEPEPTPEPTATPEPTPEPTPGPEPTQEPTPEPTPEPEPTPGPTPEPTPEPEQSVPGSPSNLAVSATASELDLSATWDALDGADTYKLAWRQDGGEFEADNAVSVTDTSATITVSDYGRWMVQLQGCNDTGCGPSVTQTAGIRPGSPANFAVTVEEGELDLSATWDALDGADTYRLAWRQDGGEFEADNAVSVMDASATITVSDYGRWVVRLEACNDAGCGAAVTGQVDVVPAPEAAGLQVSITASPASPRLNERVQLRPTIANPPAGADPSYRWEVGFSDDTWLNFGRDDTFSYLSQDPETLSFRVTVSYDTGESATSDPMTVTWSEKPPNQAPVVNKQAKYYSWFTGNNNAPRGTLVSKPFHGVFSDPDGDNLTYAVAITGGDSRLVDLMRFHNDGGSDAQAEQSGYPVDNVLRVFFRPDGEDDWKALRPPLPDRPVVTVTLTATDPEGLSASVSGDFVIGWESYPEVVRAVADGQAIELTFDWAVEANPSPTPAQFTINVVNEDGSEGTIAVTNAVANGKAVRLELASALAEGQILTLDYAYDYHDDTHMPLQRAGGGDHAPGFTGQAVVFLRPPGEPQNFAVSATAGQLSLLATWDAVDGATSYKLRWRPVGGEFEEADTATATEASSTITVSDYGQWEARLQGCNDAGCGPEASRMVDVAPAVRPGRPSSLSAGANAKVEGSSTGFSVTLKWGAPTDGHPPSGYQILRREADENSSPSVLVDDTGNTHTTYRDAAVAVGKSYIYRVKARNAAGLGEASPPSNVKIEDYHVSTGCGFDDCIRPIYNPRFLDADEVGNRMGTDEYVIGVSINGDSRAYSVAHLYGKEVVSDTVGGTPIAVTWCPNCLTTIVYDRTVAGEVYDFGASGKLMRRGEPAIWGCLVLYDHQTRSLWSQVLGARVGGEHAGTELRPVPHTLTTWGEWVKLHPDTKVLEKPQTSNNISIVVKEPDDSTWNSKWESQYAAVSVAKIGDKRIGYLFSRLADSSVQNGEFNGVNVLLFYDSGSKTALIFDRTVDGKTLSFRYDSGSGANTILVDTETGSRWKAFTGLATEGELEGKQLERIHSHSMYWMIWKNYYPNSPVYPKPVIPAQPTNLAVIAEAGSLDISATWDVLDGATSYRLRWRQSGGELEVANAMTATDASATITVLEPGQWEVRLQGCNDAGCGPEVIRTVDVALAALNPPENFAVSVEQGNLDLSATWDAVEGASSYKLRWRKSGGEFEAGNAITVSGTEATITVSSYGEWEVRLQACTASGCVPEATRSADEAPAVRLSLAPARDAAGKGSGQVRALARTFTATRDLAEDGASYTLGWRWTGTDAPAPTPAQSDSARQTRAASGPSAQGGPTDTTPPRLVRGEINGDTMTFYFSEPLDEDATGSRFRVTLDWGTGWANFTAHPSKVEVTGNKVVLVGLSYRGWPRWERAGVGNRVRVYYYINDRVVPAGERLRDLAGNEVWTPQQSPSGRFSKTRTIELDNLTAPTLLERATVSTRWLTLTFDETLDRYSVPAADAFTVTVNGSEVSLADVEPVAVSRATVTLVLASSVTSTDVVRVSYAKPSSSRLRGVDGDAMNFSVESVTNLVGVVPEVADVMISSTPADGVIYAPGETVSVRLTFTEAVTVTGAPRLKIKMGPSHGEKWADYAGGSGTTMLTFNYTVVEPDRSNAGVAVLRDTLGLNGGAVRSAATQKDAHLWYPGLDHDWNHQVDWRRSGPGIPWVTGVRIASDPGDDNTYAHGDTIHVTVTFSQAVNVTGAPRLKIRVAPYLWWFGSNRDPNLWWFDTDHAERWANYASGSGTAELTFAYTVVETNRSTQGVAVLDGPLDLNGSTIQSTTTPPVNAHLRYGELWHDRNHQVDGRAPLLLSVAVAGTTVAVTYDEALDVESVPQAGAFTVKRTPQEGAEETVALSGPPAIAAGAVLLTLADPVLDTDTGVKVSYDQPAAGDRLRDKAGNEAASFADQAADPTDTTRPRLLRGEIDGDTMTIYFNEALDEDSVGEGDYFQVGLEHKDYSPNYGQCPPQNWSFTAKPREVYVNGNTAVVVGLSNADWMRAMVDWTIISLEYYADIPAAKRLRDLSGNPVSTPHYYSDRQQRTRPIRVRNVTWLPSPERATVIGNRLTLTFGAPLNGGRTPAVSAFTVKVGGNTVSLASANPVSVSGRTVTLNLASAVPAGADVTVSYEKPLTRWLQNAVCEYAPSFSDEPVSNFTGVSPASAAVTSDPGDDDTYGRGDVIRVRLTFSEAVTVTGAPRLKIKMDPGWGEKWARYESGTGTKILTFAYTVVEPNTSPRGIAVLANSLRLTGGAIRYAWSGDPTHLAHTGLPHDPNHKVDSAAPSLRSTNFHEATVALNFHEDLDKDSTPDASAFTVKVGGSEVDLANANPVDIRGISVILTLANPVPDTGTDIKVSYAGPASAADNGLRDIVGNQTAGFTDKTAVPDETPPTLLKAEIFGDTMSLFFNEALDENSVPAATAFRAEVSTTPCRFTYCSHELDSRGQVEIRGSKVMVTVGRIPSGGVKPGNVIYYKPAGMKLQDLAGNEVNHGASVDFTHVDFTTVAD